jgi:hypothetical protein
MSTYNLKAKNKKTGEIVEFIGKRHVHGLDVYVVFGLPNDSVISVDDFNELYEVITEPQEDKGCLKIHHTCLHSDKYDYACGKCIDVMTQQAYARGQADAYRESASVAMKIDKLSERTDSHMIGYNYAKFHIAQAIEKLSSNKE